ncbi:MAG: cysteine hydrolase family protein, partial [bacterium]
MEADSRTRVWLETIAPFNLHKMRLKKRKCALLVIDMQNFFVGSRSGGLGPIEPHVLRNTKRLINAFRKGGQPVIYTRHVHRADGSDAGILGWWWPDMIVEGTWDSRIHR